MTGAHGVPEGPYRLGRDPLPAPVRDGLGNRPQLWLVRVSDYEPAADQHLLDAAERARADAFVRATDRRRYQVAHIALRRLLGAHLDTDPAAVELIREPCPCCGGPHGRPAVPGAPVHFSLSHAHDLVLLAFAGVPAGVDVEAVPSAQTVATVSSSLHPAERAELAALPEELRPAAFARCWTRKEAYLKAIGTGLGEDPSVTYVGAGPAPAQPAGWSMTDVPVGAGYAAACAVRRGSPYGEGPVAATQTARG